jgi:lipoic acid synthetase
MVKEMSPRTYTKSSIMVGLGETDPEIEQALRDLRAIGVDVVTFGQYLQPSKKHIALQQYVPLEKFNYYKQLAEQMGFLYCASGPFVRSSYKAGELFMKNVIRREHA